MDNNHISMKNLPVSERPYEKLMRFGPDRLSDAELLAIVIRTGTKNERSVELASRVLDAHESIKGLNGLHHLNAKELMQVKGIGKVKAIQLLAIAELTKRMAKDCGEAGICFTAPEDIASYYMEEMRHLEQEKVLLIMLDSKSKVIKDQVISTGTVNASLITPREVFIEALRYHAVFIILVHNHPSGDPTPSREDLLLTERFRESGSLIGIRLMDHIIIGNNVHTSLKEKGYL